MIENEIIDNAELQQFAYADRQPSLAITPNDVQQIAKLLKIAQREQKQVMIAGANSQNEFGAQVERLDWFLSLRYFKKILQHDAADLTVTVEPGVTLPQLQNHLKKYQQFLPLDPTGANNRTLGGIVATASVGPYCLRHGFCRDFVLGVKVVLPDGTIIKAGGKTVKNVAGYDLSKLFIGSMGTLGVIADITFKLTPIPAASRTLWFSHDQLNAVAALVKKICSSHLVLSRCEYLNARFLHDILHPWKLPHHLFINIADHPTAVDVAESTLDKMAAALKFTRNDRYSDDAEIEIWDKINNSATDPCSIKYLITAQATVPKAKCFAYIDMLETYFDQRNMQIAIQAHAGNGIILFSFGNKNEPTPGADQWQRVIDHCRQEAMTMAGHMILLRAPVDLRTSALVWGEPGADFSFMRQIKSRYDAEQVLVTGRFLGGL